MKIQIIIFRLYTVYNTHTLNIKTRRRKLKALKIMCYGNYKHKIIMYCDNKMISVQFMKKPGNL